MLNKKLQQYIDKIIKEFYKKYDFSEKSTLEYENLIGIVGMADWFESKLHQLETKVRADVIQEIIKANGFVAESSDIVIEYEIVEVNQNMKLSQPKNSQQSNNKGENDNKNIS